MARDANSMLPCSVSYATDAIIKDEDDRDDDQTFDEDEEGQMDGDMQLPQCLAMKKRTIDPKAIQATEKNEAVSESGKMAMPRSEEDHVDVKASVGTAMAATTATTTTSTTTTVTAAATKTAAETTTSTTTTAAETTTTMPRSEEGRVDAKASESRAAAAALDTTRETNQLYGKIWPKTEIVFAVHPR